jgi:hypothetical protein
MQHLQELELRGCLLNPALLEGLTGLRKLQLACCLLPDRHTGKRALLRALQRLTQLQVVHVFEQWMRTGAPPGVPPEPELFAALTSSAHLKWLELRHEDDQPLPPGALQHMFPEGCSKPQLLGLCITGDESIGWNMSGNDYESSLDPDEWCVGGVDRDLSYVAAACPMLRHLELSCVVQQGATFVGFQQLPESLVSLSVGGMAALRGQLLSAGKLFSLHRVVNKWSACAAAGKVGL